MRPKFRKLGYHATREIFEWLPALLSWVPPTALPQVPHISRTRPLRPAVYSPTPPLITPNGASGPTPTHTAMSRLRAPRCRQRCAPRAKSMLAFDSTTQLSERTVGSPSLPQPQLLHCWLPLGPHAVEAGASVRRRFAPRGSRTAPNWHS